MKNVLKLSLAVLAAATLAACGGGDSSEPADKYVGNWKSSCYAGTGNDGNTYYYITNWTAAKASAGQVNFSGTFLSHSDGACKNQLSSFGATPRQMNIGAETTFLGAKSDVISYVTPSTGVAFPGFATANDTTFNFVTYEAGAAIPGGWGRSSPWTKQ